MTQPTDSADGGGQVIDLMERLPPARRDAMAKAARTETRMTAAGIADASTGTVRLAAETDGRDLPVIEQVHERRGLRDLLPATLLSPRAWRHRAELVAYAAGYHTRRSPVYAWRIAQLSATGLRYGVSNAAGYLLVTEYGDMIREAKRSVKAKDGVFDNTDIASLRAERRDVGRARRRENLTVLSATGVTSYVAILVAIAELWGMALLAPALLPLVSVLAVLGVRERARRGEPLVLFDQAAAAENAPLTDTRLNEALRTAGILREDQTIQLTAPALAADGGVELRFKAKGVTVSKLRAKSEDIAAALDVPEDWIDIQALSSPGHISFWMTDLDPFAGHRPSPLFELTGPIDAVQDGIPASFDKRGRPVMLKLFELMGLIGGASRAGKGLVLRNIICGAAFDPRVRIRVATGKKPAEHSVYAPVLETFIFKQPQRLSLLLDAYEKEIDERSRYLARNGRSVPDEEDLEQMGIELLIVDESADYLDTNTANKAQNLMAEELTGKLDSIARGGAGVGVFVLLAIQDPKKGMVNTRLLANLLERWCLRVADAASANAVLGSGSVGKGLRPQDIKREQAPLGVRKGAEGEMLTKAYMIDQNKKGEAARLIARAVEVRARYGALPGQRPDPIEDALMALTGLTSVRGGIDGLGDPAPAGAAAGPSAGGDRPGILSQMLAVFRAADDPERLRTAELLAGLAQLDPDTWSAAALSVDEDDDAAYVRTGGAEMRRAIDAELEGTGRTLPSRGWTAGGRANGYYLADVRAAAGITPE
ncbi:hypothetical protein [Streptomyces rubradiris]|uniref:FtsK domain-containing protein n=1 Tax=Streptomyces rubradiris TaxID=285531 RepID=A0ABQ3RAE5_STRRR|nr:hypothetical protein [Streptomyces rubradiris]GHH26105.1 hypothetical protein GCM10018792_66170 [Streptomyces rubradiris]GHI52822.1 hypothetical protein Srubr_26680 [Streptomyces rubradiris]